MPINKCIFCKQNVIFKSPKDASPSRQLQAVYFVFCDNAKCSSLFRARIVAMKQFTGDDDRYDTLMAQFGSYAVVLHYLTRKASVNKGNIGADKFWSNDKFSMNVLELNMNIVKFQKLTEDRINAYLMMK